MAKYDQGKSRVDLIPPDFIIELGNVLKHGAEKYAPNDWQTLPYAEDRYYAAALRHLLAYRKGEKVDKESGLSHLSHAACNLAFLHYFEERRDV